MNELCRRFQESYGEIDCSEELANHGSTCESCQEFTKRQEQLRNILPAWKAPKPSSQFALNVISRVAESHTRKRSVRELLGELFHLRITVPLPIGALASVLFLASIFMNLFFWTEHQTGEMIPNSNGQVVVSPDVPTPSTFHAANQSNYLPRVWNGAGAFLLIPMVDFPSHIMPIENGQTNPSEDDSGKI